MVKWTKEKPQNEQNQDATLNSFDVYPWKRF